MKKPLVITVAIVAAALLSLGGYALFRGEDQPADSSNNSSTSESADDTPAPAGEEADERETPHAERTVTYNDNGFVSKTLSVKAGTTVFFTNGSSQPMWVASDPHPVHTDLSGFDAKKGIAPGESYQYTFKTKGNWGFHNHLNSAHRGSITVE